MLQHLSSPISCENACHRPEAEQQGCHLLNRKRWFVQTQLKKCWHQSPTSSLLVIAIIPLGSGYPVVLCCGLWHYGAEIDWLPSKPVVKLCFFLHSGVSWKISLFRHDLLSDAFCNVSVLIYSVNSMGIYSIYAGDPKWCNAQWWITDISVALKMG